MCDSLACSRTRAQTSTYSFTRVFHFLVGNDHHYYKYILLSACLSTMSWIWFPVYCIVYIMCMAYIYYVCAVYVCMHFRSMYCIYMIILWVKYPVILNTSKKIYNRYVRKWSFKLCYIFIETTRNKRQMQISYPDSELLVGTPSKLGLFHQHIWTSDDFLNTNYGCLCYIFSGTQKVCLFHFNLV